MGEAAVVAWASAGCLGVLSAVVCLICALLAPSPARTAAARRRAPAPHDERRPCARVVLQVRNDQLAKLGLPLLQQLEFLCGAHACQAMGGDAPPAG